MRVSWLPVFREIEAPRISVTGNNARINSYVQPQLSRANVFCLDHGVLCLCKAAFFCMQRSVCTVRRTSRAPPARHRVAFGVGFPLFYLSASGCAPIGPEQTRCACQLNDCAFLLLYVQCQSLYEQQDLQNAIFLFFFARIFYAGKIT